MNEDAAQDAPVGEVKAKNGAAAMAAVEGAVMGAEEPRLDPDYFSAELSWAQRLDRARERARRDLFVAANTEVTTTLLAAEQPGVRAVVNIGADALFSVLQEGRYRNAYERPRIAGRDRDPSPKRREIDQLVLGERAPQTYFGAVSMGGTGCRFYGEFCMVLRPEHVDGAEIFDRNSYDIANPPLAAVSDKVKLVRTLAGRWPQDLGPILTLKILPTLRNNGRLTTPGQVSDEILRDEDFVEIHVDVPFGPGELEEVRRSPEESTAALELRDQRAQGESLTMAEQIWLDQRDRTERELRRRGVRVRTVTTTGRGARWR